MLTKIELLNKVKELNNIADFNEVQNKAIPQLEKNIVVSSPTSSGKTLIAEIASLETILNKKRKVIYTCPLKALASEHYSNFKKKYEKEFGIKCAISIGDLDSSSKYLENYNIIFTTYEKLDSLIRHKSFWLYSIGLLVIDELHMLDSDRGPTIEVSVIQLNLMVKDLQTLGLSATIPNYKQLAEWLNAEAVYSEHRPVALKKGVLVENKIYFEKETEEIDFSNDKELHNLIKDTLKKNKQALIFTNTRKNAQSLANQIKTTTLKEKVNEYDFDSENLTSFDKEIIDLMRHGVAFHHAGLRAELREKIEADFRNGKIKIISATPTLAAGVNTPAFRVIIHSMYRHSINGMQKIPIREYHQMAGRAGRAGYDEKGEAIILGKDEYEKDRLFEEYIFAEPEEVLSQIGNLSVLRTLLLSLIANGIVYDDESMLNFFKKTLYYLQFKNESLLYERIRSVLDELLSYGFIKITSKIEATEIGKRVSELYIDPLSAYNIINYLSFLEKHNNEFAQLYCLVNTIELKPYPTVSKTMKDIGIELNEKSSYFLADPYAIFEEYDMPNKFLLVKIFYDWINEVSDQELLDRYDMQPGILHQKVENMKWIAYATKELAELSGREKYKDLIKEISLFEKRLQYGIRKDLLFLVELPGIGRVRARKLFYGGVRNIGDLRSADPIKLAGLIGQKTRDKLYEHLKINQNK
ncbi:MAG: DEAD/DEAH box helicase [Candidatus ainarchaeum sp.]|nr:DEAD/DEAH box helicase [Candidatus ainarchaeum sp.]